MGTDKQGPEETGWYCKEISERQGKVSAEE